MAKNVKYPALAIADDGWVEYFENSSAVANWGWPAIAKYNARRLIFLDSQDVAWRVKRISPLKPFGLISRILAYTVYSPLVPISIEFEALGKDSIAEAKELLRHAIDADDDGLTQWVSAKTLKNDVQGAHSFDEVVAVLKKRRAI